MLGIYIRLNHSYKKKYNFESSGPFALKFKGIFVLLVRFKWDEIQNFIMTPSKIDFFCLKTILMFQQLPSMSICQSTTRKCHQKWVFFLKNYISRNPEQHQFHFCYNVCQFLRELPWHEKFKWCKNMLSLQG